MNWQDSLRIQAAALAVLPEDGTLSDDIDDALELSRSTRGIFFFAGIGKNGFVAAKVASTFNSLGIRSMFVHPVDTLHGDMDIFNAHDLMYVLSKSGETAELIVFVQALLHNGFGNIILMTSQPSSTLSRLSLRTICARVPHEGDHLDLAPITSSVVYMAVLQAMAVQLSCERGFSRADFVRCHPGGTLGKTRVDI